MPARRWSKWPGRNTLPEQSNISVKDRDLIVRITESIIRSSWLLLLLALCGTPVQADSSAEAPRLISIGGAVTEIVYALGAGERLIAVDSTSLWPSKAEALPDVGYMRALAAEPILALEPTLILASADAGPPQVLEQLRAAGAHLVMVPEDPTPQGIFAKIESVAGALNLENEGRQLIVRLKTEFDALSQALQAVEHQPRVLFLLSVTGGAPLAGGRDTAAAGIIELAGGKNAITAFEGFKPLSPEAAIAAAPEVLLVARSTTHTGKNLLDRPGLALTPAGREQRVVAMDALLLLGFGPRTPEAARQLAEALYPDLQFDPPAAQQTGSAMPVADR